MSRSALSTFRAKEEEIERKKMEVREKVQAHLGRVEEETKRLATIREVCRIRAYIYYTISYGLEKGKKKKLDFSAFVEISESRVKKLPRFMCLMKRLCEF